MTAGGGRGWSAAVVEELVRRQHDLLALDDGDRVLGTVARHDGGGGREGHAETGEQAHHEKDESGTAGAAGVACRSHERRGPLLLGSSTHPSLSGSAATGGRGGHPSGVTSHTRKSAPEWTNRQPSWLLASAPGVPSHSTTWVTWCRRRLSADTSPVAHTSSTGVSSTTTTVPPRSTDSAVLTSVVPGTARGSGSRNAGSPAQAGRRRGCHGSESTVGDASVLTASITASHSCGYATRRYAVCTERTRSGTEATPSATTSTQARADAAAPPCRASQPTARPTSTARVSTAGASIRCWSRARATPGTRCAITRTSSPGPDAHQASVAGPSRARHASAAVTRARAPRRDLTAPGADRVISTATPPRASATSASDEAMATGSVRESGWAPVAQT